MIIERHGDVKPTDYMTTFEARERINRFLAGGDLFDFSNWYLSVDHLRLICNSLVYQSETINFLADVMSWARQQILIEENEREYKYHTRQYKMIRRQANKLYRQLQDAEPTLF